MGNKDGWMNGLAAYMRGNDKAWHLAAAACIAFLGFALYANTLGNGFVMDDRIVVENNHFISSWANLKYLFDPRKYFLASGEMTFRPVTTMSYFWDYSFWRYNPSGYHLTNILLHAANGIFLYFILFSLVTTSGRTGLALSEPGGTVRMAPFAAALFFVSHPLQTEGVNFIGGRHDILMATFFLAAVFLYQRAVDPAKGFDPGFYLSSVLAYALSCLSKEPGITLPAVLLLVDAFTCPESGKTAFWKKRAPLYAGFCAVAVLFLCARSIWMVRPGEYLQTDPKRFAVIGGILLNYLRLLVFPATLSAEYVAGEGYHKAIPDSFAQPEAYVPTAIMLFILAAVVALRRRFPMVLFGTLWFVITILPSSNVFFLLTSFPMREKYVYLPAAGFYTAIAFLICRLAEKAAPPQARPLAARRIAAVAAALLVLAYSARTLARNADWKDEVSLWTATIKTSPGSYRAYYNLGMAYQYDRGDSEKAIEAFKISLECRDFAMTHDAIGMVYFRQGLYADAERELLTAQKSNPALGSVYYHLGLLYVAMGEYDKAIALQEEGFRSAKEVFPYYTPVPRADMHAVSGRAYLAKNDLVRAMEQFGKSLDIRPGDPETSYLMGKASVMAGLYDKAAAAFNDALRANPQNVEARYALAGVYLRTNALAKAEREYAEILKIDPANADSRNNLANIFYARGLAHRAAEEYRKVLESDPRHFKARNNLANIYLMNGDFDKAISEYRKILDAQPRNAVVHYNLGLAYEGKGMVDKAEEEWRAALGIDPAFAQAAEALRQSASRKGPGK